MALVRQLPSAQRLLFARLLPNWKTFKNRRRRWPAAEKLRIVEETLYDGESISAVARRNGVAPNLLYRWRKLMLEGGSIAVTGNDSVTSNKEVREMEARIRELERQLGRKTLENEILKEALEKSAPVAGESFKRNAAARPLNPSSINL